MPRTSTKLGLLLLALLALLAPRSTAAPDDTALAAETFQAAEKAYAREDYRAAAVGFEATHELVPHGAALFNAGEAWNAAGEEARAADAFARALEIGGLASNQARTARSRLAGLKSGLGRVVLSAPPGSLIWLAHLEGVPPPVKLYLPPGRHEARAQLPSGEEREREFSVSAGKRASVSFDPRPAPQEAPVGPEMPDDQGPPDAEGESGSVLAVGLITLGTSAVAAAVAIALGVSALDARDEFDASGYTDRDAHAEADSLRTATNVSWAAAGVLAATSAVLLVVYLVDGDPDPSTASAQLRLSPQGAWLTGEF